MPLLHWREQWSGISDSHNNALCENQPSYEGTVPLVAASTHSLREHLSALR
ncbi:hypothetical protein [Ktedonospora formicarum]|uniref:hypothetical protein n=1 Tax=Ktedonospora formicarum TaxID=2778364 RepID=UPI001C68ECA0|nr:hypothetical protein [Ktedonospora formicarum]